MMTSILTYIVCAIIVIAAFIWNKLQEVRPINVTKADLVVLAIQVLFAPITVTITAAVLIYAMFEEYVVDKIYKIPSLAEKIIFKF